ncbi:hypothetical protein [Streptomyces griseorubiginosus]|uniref:hypothetical protein n=1 Tax=Streptomyces griseorubiginosus TaxID=67304 RepID=UPI001AD6B70B|nr:hypothetical protein [Streptomyces griseorubiginosus]MBO4258686.1 hypothetical protein [Streptomyces griseorubiginosus]
MTTAGRERSRRVAAAAGILTVTCVVAGVVILALGVGVPQGWWPHTGRAFTGGARTPRHDPCDLIAGPGKAYCRRGTTATAVGRQCDVAGAARRLATAGAGVAVLVVWRLRSATGQRRR